MEIKPEKDRADPVRSGRTGLCGMGRLSGRSVLRNGSKGYGSIERIVEISRPFVDETLLAYVQGIALMKTMDDEWKNQTRGNVGLR